MKKYYIYLSLISITLFLGISILGGYPGHHIKFLVSALVYCTFSFIVLLRNPERRVKFYSILIILIPFLLLDLPVHLIDFNETQMSLPSTLANFIGVGFGILIYLSNKYLKIALSILLIIGATWMAFIGYSFWLHKINFGTFTGSVNEKVTCQIEGKDQLGNLINNQVFNNKYIVIDFWNTHCGICFHEFPEFQKLYDAFKDEPNISFLAINKPLKVDTLGQAFQMIKQRNYTFPILVPVDEKLPEKFGVEFYPTIIILDRQRMAIFRGSVERAGSVIQGIIKNGM